MVPYWFQSITSYACLHHTTKSSAKSSENGLKSRNLVISKPTFAILFSILTQFSKSAQAFDSFSIFSTNSDLSATVIYSETLDGSVGGGNYTQLLLAMAFIALYQITCQLKRESCRHSNTVPLESTIQLFIHTMRNR